MSPTAFYGSWLAIGMLGIVIGLVSWQWAEWRNREDDISSEDRTHFSHQDRRRGLVSVVMATLAAGVYFGSRMPSLTNGRPNLLFVSIWLGIFTLILLLIILAMLDWLATQRYARRHRDAIVREGMRAFHDEISLQLGPDPSRNSSGSRNGSPESIP